MLSSFLFHNNFAPENELIIFNAVMILGDGNLNDLGVGLVVMRTDEGDGCDVEVGEFDFLQGYY